MSAASRRAYTPGDRRRRLGFTLLLAVALAFGREFRATFDNILLQLHIPAVFIEALRRQAEPPHSRDGDFSA